MDFTQNVMTSWLNTSQRKGRGTPRYKFPWQPGRNNLRLLPFTHRITEYDLKREGYSSLGLRPEHVGKEGTFLFVPITRFFKGSHRTIGLATRDCPMQQAFWNKEEGAIKPGFFFVANVVCTDQPELGVLQVAFSRADWMGPMSKKVKTGYGISDVLFGYDPSASAKGDEEGDDEALGATASVQLGELPAQMDKVVGFDKRDLSIWKVHDTIGGKPALVLDESVSGGHIKLRSADQSPTLDPAVYGQGMAKGVVDLLSDPQYFPGFDSEGNHLTELAYDFAAAFGNERNKKQSAQAQELQEESGDTSITDVEESAADETEPVQEEVVQQAVLSEEPVKEEAKEAPKKGKKKTKKELRPGDRVQFKEGDTAYVGTLLAQDDDADVWVSEESDCKVELKPDEQPTDSARQDVEGLIEGGNECAIVKWSKIRVA